MSSEWFRELALQWDPAIDWSEEDLQELAADLQRIAFHWSGRVFEDEDISQEEIKAYAQARVTSILDAVVRSNLAAVHPRVEAPHCYWDSDAFEPELLLLKPVRYERQLNLNAATVTELVALPAIGQVLAERIVALRGADGPFERLEQLEVVPYIGEETVRRISPFVYVGPAHFAAPRIRAPGLEDLLENTTFAQYVRFARDSGVSLSRYAGDHLEDSLPDRIKAEVRLASDRVAQLSTPINSLPGIRASTLRKREERDQRVALIELLAATDSVYGAVIEDSTYPFFVRDLLKTAENTVRLIMFFMRFEDSASYPTDDVISELVAAGERGLDVKVILDRDAEGAAIGATVVNQEAFDHLQDSGIDVRWDTVERVTHTKLLVVDDRQIVIGSHNWTAGSFFAYDDTSVYVRSIELAAYYHSQFDQLWEIYEV